MRTEVISNNRLILLKKLNNCGFIRDFYLAGGTGLSLVYGYRESYDFDFFCYHDFNPNEILSQIKKELNSYNIEVINIKTNLSSIDLYIDGVQLSFFQYSYPMLGDFTYDDETKNIAIASIEDIACMKASEINQRGSKKDFFDLFHIFKETNLNEYQFIDLLTKKYNDKNLLVSLLYAFSFFEDAEKEKMPNTFVEYSWDEIKEFFYCLSIKMKKCLFK